MKALALAVILSSAVAAPALAEQTRGWTATVALHASRTDGQAGASDQTSQSGSISLSRQFGNGEMGGTIGVSGDDSSLPEVVTVLSASSYNGALWWGSSLGPVDVRITGTIGRQDLDGSVVRMAQLAAASRLPASFRTSSLSVGGKRSTQGLTLEVSHTFGDAVSVTPFASIGLDRTTTDVKASLASTENGGATVSDSAEGVSGALGVSFGRKLGERATFSFSAAANATDNAAARIVTGSGAGLAPRGQSGNGAEQWGDFGVGLSLRIMHSVSLGVSLNGTAGREENDLGGGLSVSRSF